MDGTTLGVLLLSGLCLVPLAIGFVLGRGFERRTVMHGMPWALIPDFIRNLIERNLQ